MRRLRILYILLSLTICDAKGQTDLASLFADSTTENCVPVITEMTCFLDTLLYTGNKCDLVLERAKVAHTEEIFNELCSLIDTLKMYRVGGLLRSLLYYETINNSVYRNDTVSAFKYLLEFRDFSGRCLEKGVTNPFNYGLGLLDPASNKWLSEGEWAIRLYHHKALNLAIWYPYDAAVQFAYESLLQTKGLSLMADNTFKFMANELNNDTIRTLYKQLLRIQKEYKELDAMYRSDWWKYHDEYDSELLDYPRLHSMKKEIEAIKDSIFAIANSDYSYIVKFFPQWAFIKEHLAGNEVSVEFASVYTLDGSTRYIAMVVDKNSEVPQLFDLCNEESLAAIDITRPHDFEKIKELIWEPIKDCLMNKTRIYFSADGILHTLPIESLLNDKMAFRLTSTRELIKPHPKSDAFNIVAYGGLDYNSYDTISQRTKHYVRGTSSSKATRGTRGFLKGTLAEVEKLEEIVNKKSNASIFTYKGSCGSEDSFYQLEGSSYNILHIATHGFYYTPKEIEEKNREKQNYTFIDFDGEGTDKSLTHTGMLFSGANNVLKGEPAPNGYEDGILTAKEIADTDFSNFDMVVMSACQTGLGEIRSEGVFGLQRGFKKAGVQTIVMSLWKVDDAATKMLMTEFYRNLLGGMSKRESLLKAQDAVRDFKGYINGEKRNFSNPKYWAGFIMLDGIE